MNEYVTFQENLIKYMTTKNKDLAVDYDMFDSQVLDMQDKLTYERPSVEVNPLI